MTANSLTINYLHNGAVQFSDIRSHGHAHRAIALFLSRQGMTVPAEVDTMAAGDTLDLGNGLAVQLIDTDADALRDATAAFHDSAESHCDQCGSKLPASRHCTNCR